MSDLSDLSDLAISAWADGTGNGRSMAREIQRRRKRDAADKAARAVATTATSPFVTVIAPDELNVSGPDWVRMSSAYRTALAAEREAEKPSLREWLAMARHSPSTRPLLDPNQVEAAVSMLSHYRDQHGSVDAALAAERKAERPGLREALDYVGEMIGQCSETEILDAVMWSLRDYRANYGSIDAALEEEA